ncbi:methyltransferase domain-containing protein [Rubrivivax sp. RP6-9]|uniref:methyltransferase domain-containing protein n=1 Tax=Rubrivivax sp. RP6-9 TaxID=3415750 RepID=UPI003CC6033D
MTLARTVSAETLDHLAPDDPAARRSRRDLVRVHRAMGTRAIVAGGWQALVGPARAAAPLRILELGAGDGTLLLGLARALAPRWPQVQLCLLDRQDIVAPATLAGFAALGWQVRVQAIDVLAWAARPEATVPGTRWDLITTSLFLHHFDGAAFELLLGAAAARCDRFFACEPRRSGLALAGSHLVGALGANAVTREDAVRSVHAGFRGTELDAHWPRAGGHWHTREGAAGLFSHCFSAWRSGTPR